MGKKNTFDCPGCFVAHKAHCMNPCHPGFGCLNNIDDNQRKSRCLLGSSAVIVSSLLYFKEDGILLPISWS